MTAREIILVISVLYLFTACSSDTRGKREDLRAQYDSCRICIKEHFQTSLNSALSCAKTEIELGKTIGDSKLVLTGYLDASRSLYHLYQYEPALNYAHKALALSKEIGDPDSNAEAKRLCGAIYTDLDNKDLASKYLDEALAYYVARKDTGCCIRTLGTKAIALGKSEEYDECKRALHQVYRLSSHRKNYEMMLTTLLNLTNVYTITNNIGQGYRMLDSIRLTIPSRYITPKDSLVIRSYIGELLSRQKKYGQAKKILKESVPQMRAYRQYEVLQSSLKTLIKIAKAEKDFANFALYFDEAFDIQDSIVSIETRNKVNEMELLFNVARKDAEIDKLLMQNKWNRQKLVFIIIILITSGAFILIKIRSNARMIAFKAEVLDKELKGKREELTNLAIYYFEQRGMTDNLYKNLKQISNASEDPVTRKALHGVCSGLIKSSANDTKSKINDYIDSKYKDFILKISSQCSDLTDSEKRICTMLLVDFSTKEISEVLNISDRSINNLRSKIRKKLNIPEDVTIPNFLKKL